MALMIECVYASEIQNHTLTVHQEEAYNHTHPLYPEEREREREREKEKEGERD